MIWRGRKLHLIAVGGTGMSGLALVAAELGAEVTGSDRQASSYTERLVENGIAVTIGHDAANVPAGADVVISTAISADNPELLRAGEFGLRVIHRSDLLAELVAAKPRCIAVAGTHGKTTTTAMIAHVLSELGADPAFFVGGEVRVAGGVVNAHWGDGDIAVVEADESDRSHLKLNPDVGVVTNVELDHHPAYAGGIDELLDAFGEYAGNSGYCVAWRGQSELARLNGRGGGVGYGIARDGDSDGEFASPAAGFAAGDFVAYDVSTPTDPTRGSSFELRRGGEVLAVELGIRGEHNVLNALAVLAALDRLGIPPA
ncbi:MAG: Mur ligase domain-containing protein, partial [Solirubrobacterales bacterium]